MAECRVALSGMHRLGLGRGGGYVDLAPRYPSLLDALAGLAGGQRKISKELSHGGNYC
jgi:hypothetical protein